MIVIKFVDFYEIIIENIKPSLCLCAMCNNCYVNNVPIYYIGIYANLGTKKLTFAL